MLTNPIVLSVFVMIALCLLKVNIIIAILIASILAGFLAGMPINEIMSIFVGGMGAHNSIALAYVLLGALAYGIQSTGLATKFTTVLERLFGKSGKVLILIIAVIASLSQNLVPIHIAFIPILIPPLLGLMNKMKIDRRAVACALAFGLKAPYILIPAGFGLIFHNIIATNISNNGMDVDATHIWPHMILPAVGMLVGLLIAVFITHRKPREYEDLPIEGAVSNETDNEGFTLRHWGALLGTLTTFIVQIWAQATHEGSPLWALPVGATLGLLIMLATGAIKFNQFDDTIKGGLSLMGFIAFVMLVAGGYAAVIRATYGIDALVGAAYHLIGNSRLLAVIAMQLIGLLITLGIGTSFGTIPIIATVFVPLCIAMGFSPAATIVLITTAGATGDAGVPASDTALGPTAGLNADGQHDHIWDTCIPTFLHFNIPIKVVGIIAAMLL
ncbi:MAG: SLC13 family permease [Defluviitaleaceae bacterium]|nr:SLC13 family permease [Defluviitaleaceae bacterium]